MGCYHWHSEERPGRAAAPPIPLLAEPNVTAHPLTASAPISVLLYDGPLLCGFIVAIKGLNEIWRGCLIRRTGRLAALWPLLGLGIEVLVLCVIIVAYEIKRNKRLLLDDDVGGPAADDSCDKTKTAA